MFYKDICKDINEIQNLRTDYLSYLRGPQEAWLEEQVYVRNPDFYVFGYGDQRIGYCCVDLPKRLLLQFYISEEFLQFSITAFEALLNDKKIKLAYVTTRDPLTISLCLTFQNKITLEAYLFVHCFSTNIELKNISDPQFRLAEQEDLAKILNPRELWRRPDLFRMIGPSWCLFNDSYYWENYIVTILLAAYYATCVYLYISYRAS